ncbi:hypothetical protein Bca52824_086578 [Brassica carinata]|uniref:Uncharacterized protein n=1 Tax=Brassica carinata TaxID=52824 RepID=A0A8X7P9B0_BRACI|nr:hypothetical protein Bca52824_086578 [Brassica carinata]
MVKIMVNQGYFSQLSTAKVEGFAFGIGIPNFEHLCLIGIWRRRVIYGGDNLQCGRSLPFNACRTRVLGRIAQARGELPDAYLIGVCNGLFSGLLFHVKSDTKCNNCPMG